LLKNKSLSVLAAPQKLDTQLIKVQFFMAKGYKKGRRLLLLRPVSGAYCHHGSLTPVFTLFPVTPPADNRCGDNSRKDRCCQVVPESHGKLRERHIAAFLL